MRCPFLSFPPPRQDYPRRKQVRRDPASVTVGDLNSDGKLDPAVCSGGTSPGHERGEPRPTARVQMINLLP
jgi:hypothetical protein